MSYTRSRFLLLSVFFVGGVVLAAAATTTDCRDVIKSEVPRDGLQCVNKWPDLKPLLRPTQSALGYAWVQRKLDKDFGSLTDAQSAMNDDVIPTVAGPDGSGGVALFAVDGHHTLGALERSSFNANIRVTVDVLCDRSDLSVDEFWTELDDHELVYANSRPPGEKDTLPTPFDPATSVLMEPFSFEKGNTTFDDDVWRSLAGFARKTKNETCEDSSKCMRCFDRICDEVGDAIAFFEFRWSYFFNTALKTDDTLWPSSETQSAFVDCYSGLPDADVGDIDTAAWQTCADLLVPLCRGEQAGEFQLPADLFEPYDGGTDHLPGYQEGWTPMEKDPTCKEMDCN